MDIRDVDFHQDKFGDIDSANISKAIREFGANIAQLSKTYKIEFVQELSDHDTTARRGFCEKLFIEVERSCSY